MWRSLHDAWWRLATQHHPQRFSDALACAVLSAGSVLYRAGIGLRAAAYRRRWIRPVRLPCPVISIGNLTVGGTGKTACVELVARKLLERGRRVAVLSRGYGGTHRGDYHLVKRDGDLAVLGCVAVEELADEPQLVAEHLEGVPVLVGPNRVRTGRAALKHYGAECLILDDGFQHWPLARDCDIVLVSARMPLGGWGPLPRGPMREPVSALSRAQVIVVTKADEVAQTVVAAMRERFKSMASEASVVTAIHEPCSLIDGASGLAQEWRRLNRTVVGLVSSIGDPAGFDATVRRLAGGVAWHQRYPDHFRYAAGDWERICDRAQESRVDAVVTTEKDWVRLKPLARSRPIASVLVLGVRMRLVSGEKELDARLDRLCAP